VTGLHFSHHEGIPDPGAHAPTSTEASSDRSGPPASAA
jgi:hypothetical protein